MLLNSTDHCFDVNLSSRRVSSFLKKDAKKHIKTKCESNCHFHTSLIFNDLKEKLPSNIHPR
jgi:hypothetical protein